MESFNKHFTFDNEILFKSINKQKRVNIYLPVNCVYTNEYLNIIPHSHQEKIEKNMNLTEINRLFRIREECCRINPAFALPDFFIFQVFMKMN